MLDNTNKLRILIFANTGSYVNYNYNLIQNTWNLKLYAQENYLCLNTNNDYVESKPRNVGR